LTYEELLEYKKGDTLSIKKNFKKDYFGILIHLIYEKDLDEKVYGAKFLVCDSKNKNNFLICEPYRVKRASVLMTEKTIKRAWIT
jgi:hypothetical protein